MGMFDNVKCEVPLPDGHNAVCQTKDFDMPYLETYVIRADGRLMKGDQDMNFHGILNFYDYTDEGIWHEYDAKFTDGRLVGISVVPAEVQ